MAHVQTVQGRRARELEPSSSSQALELLSSGINRRDRSSTAWRNNASY